MSKITAATVAAENDRIYNIIDAINDALPEELTAELANGTAAIYPTTYNVSGPGKGHATLIGARLLFVADRIKTIVDTERGTIASAYTAEPNKPWIDEQDSLVVTRREYLGHATYAFAKYLGLK